MGGRLLMKMGAGAAIGAGLGLGGTCLVVPVVLKAVGFTAGGIASASLGSKMMAASAVANGGGVAAGGLVATLQSVGAAGLSLATKLGVTAMTASGGTIIGAFKKDLSPADPPLPVKK
ncbi:interferon alpha-inducible protein 27-like protein 2A [Hemicordylus capensis]|uniref:interferon alpha-inducible protein 27-like protein 2A n=1 Tax=Hemicordylus capensis TaxID=884348 RepID=UPI002303E9C1|nr:interferon alpha-inducible protein 27-like protein 2A [Hemicordylus capensis]